MSTAEPALAPNARDLLVSAAAGVFTGAEVGGRSLHAADGVWLALTRRIGDHRPVDRPLPTDLAAVLRRAREVELAAGTRAQSLEAVRATTVLAAAARREGWTTSELAAGLGIPRKSLDRRLHRHTPEAPDGLLVTPAPPSRIDPPLPPLELREWLTRTEAVELTGLSESGLDQWRTAGLLPSTKPAGHRRYARSDLERVLAAGERDGRGVRKAQLRQRLNDGGQTKWAGAT